MIPTTLITMLATAVIFWRIFQLAPAMSWRDFDQSPVCLALFAAGVAAIGAGAVSILFGLPFGGDLLLVGVAIVWVTDRRRCS